MRNFLWLVLATAVVQGSILGAALYLPTITGVHDPDVHPSYFLRWLPGMAIAPLSGALGAFFNGLIAIWAYYETKPQPKEAAPSVVFILRPVLGAISGFLLFLFFAAGAFSLGRDTTLAEGNGDSIGTLIYELSPRSTGQLAVTLLLTFIGGYFFPALPKLLEGYQASIFGRGEADDSARRNDE